MAFFNVGAALAVDYSLPGRMMRMEFSNLIGTQRSGILQKMFIKNFLALARADSVR